MLVLLVLAAHVGSAQQVVNVTTSSPTFSAYNDTLVQLESLLDVAHSEMTARLSPNSTHTNDACSLSRACGATPASLANYTVDFRSFPAPEYDFVQTKAFLDDAYADHQRITISAATTDELCHIDALQVPWRDVQRIARGQVLFQYYAGSSNNFGVYPPLQWNCSNPYIPSQRPYYVAGATGGKNIVLLIDVSGIEDGAAERLRMAKAAAKALASTASYADFMNVIVYATNASPIFPRAVRMTLANVPGILEAIDRLELVAGEGSNIGGALTAAAQAKQALEADARGSGCSTLVVLLSGGSNDIVTSLPEYVADQAGLVVFTHYLAPATINVTQAADTRLRRLACRSRAMFATSRNASDAESNVLNVLDYLQRIAPNAVTRWSEVYTDAFGQGRIVTAVRPVYVNFTLQGMMAIDVSFANISLGGTLSESDVAALQQGTLTCTPLNIDATAEIVSRIYAEAGGMCDGVSPVVDEELPIVDLKIVLASLTGIVVLVLLAIPTTTQACSPNDTTSCFKLAAFAYVALWGTALGIFWGYGFDNIIEYKTFHKVTYTIDDTSSAPYRCCERASCVCTDVLAPACDEMIVNLTTGPCNNGFRCCRNDCRDCFCGNNSEGVYQCSQCCGCTQSVLNEQCQVVCGTCHSVSADVSYEFRGSRIQSKFLRTCPRDDVGCPADFLRLYVVGEQRVGFVNPTNPKDLRTDVGFNQGALIAALVCATVSIIPWTVMMFLSCYGTLQGEKLKRRREYEVPEPKVTIEVNNSAIMSPKAADEAPTPEPKSPSPATPAASAAPPKAGEKA